MIPSARIASLTGKRSAVRDADWPAELPPLLPAQLGVLQVLDQTKSDAPRLPRRELRWCARSPPDALPPRTVEAMSPRRYSRKGSSSHDLPSWSIAPNDHLDLEWNQLMLADGVKHDDGDLALGLALVIGVERPEL